MTRKHFFLTLKIAVSAYVIYMIGQRVEPAKLIASVKGADFLHLFLATIFAIMAVPTVSVRWRKVGAIFGLTIPVGLATRSTFAGLFVGQVLPGAIGADVVRGWMVWQEGLRNRLVVITLIFDRLISLLAIGFMMALTLPLLLQHAPLHIRNLAGILAAGGAASCVMLFVLYISNKDYWKKITHQAIKKINPADKKISIRALATPIILAIMGHALFILSAYFISLAMKIDSNFWAWWVIMPAVTLLTALPISVNGWGVRELAMVKLWSIYGINNTDAFLISVSMGLVAIIASLPGLVFWIVRRRETFRPA